MSNTMLRWLSRSEPHVPPAVPARRRETYCYLGDHRALTVTHRGHKIFLDTNDIGMTPHIALDGVWEREVEMLLGRLLRPGAKAVEVGSNMGYHTLAMAEAIGAAGHIHAFEANPVVLPLLRATIAVNGFAPRVTLHPEAALDTAGMVEFTSDPEHIGSGHLAVLGEGTNYSRRVSVKAVTLDEALQRRGPLDLLRMDAEGTEPQVLRGAATLLRESPELVIVTEWSAPMMAARSDLGAMIFWLEEMGFRFWWLGAEARLEPVATAALPELPHGEVIIARSLPGGLSPA
ncbi:FkbM family methyltransferase [Siccirubricoccus sp. KC 17139]|uniref:FkbM family methyltransferase n=1 Tax=Siccirubricoccus soli TaxID=2899147 RepID=A0ABT1DDV9_9PROT|nr:FkbM family methyltransferase [Siccirubricoccus soli]MCO6419440.1 FkbM family methyltransferase [Siccirubricoccus soli]MCP2685575.1 FkbM family methyltransferase [Siccirubricoccus soli]